MEKGELRKLLTVAKKTPVNAAIGMMKDGTPALLLHKIKQPRALSKELEGSGELKNMRWGEFFVDEEKDPKTLVARLNKPASGMARKLVKVVKFAGFSKVVLQFEDGTTEEGGDEEGDEAAPPADGAQPVAAGEPAAAAAAPPQQGPDLGPVTARITALVKRMLPLVAADPSRGDSLKTLAKGAQGFIRGGDLGQAESATNALEQAVTGFEATAAAPASGQAPTDPATLAKARSAWIAVRQRIDVDLNKLLDAVRATYRDHRGLGQIEQRVQKELDGVRAALDDELARKLDEMGKAATAERPKLVAEAKQIAQRYQQHIATDKVMGALDDNPFVPLSVQKTVTAALSAIVSKLH